VRRAFLTAKFFGTSHHGFTLDFGPRFAESEPRDSIGRSPAISSSERVTGLRAEQSTNAPGKGGSSSALHKMRCLYSAVKVRRLGFGNPWSPERDRREPTTLWLPSTALRLVRSPSLVRGSQAPEERTPRGSSLLFLSRLLIIKSIRCLRDVGTEGVLIA